MHAQLTQPRVGRGNRRNRIKSRTPERHTGTPRPLYHKVAVDHFPSRQDSLTGGLREITHFPPVCEMPPGSPAIAAGSFEGCFRLGRLCSGKTLVCSYSHWWLIVYRHRFVLSLVGARLVCMIWVLPGESANLGMSSD
jgi:hypothetical protein